MSRSNTLHLTGWCRMIHRPGSLCCCSAGTWTGRRLSFQQESQTAGGSGIPDFRCAAGSGVGKHLAWNNTDAGWLKAVSHKHTHRAAESTRGQVSCLPSRSTTQILPYLSTQSICNAQKSVWLNFVLAATVGDLPYNNLSRWARLICDRDTQS